MNTLRTFIARFAGALVLAVFASSAIAEASITANKQFAPAIVNLGGSTQVQVELTNNDITSSAAITAFKDDVGTMAGGGTVDGGTAPTTTCPGGTPVIAGNVVTMNNGVIPIAPDGTHPGTCFIFFNVFGSKAGNSVNSILTSDVVAGGQSPAGVAVQQTLTVNSANVAVSATGNQNVPFGTTVTQVFTITNPTSTVPLTNAAFSINSNSGTQAYTVSSATTDCGATLTSALPTNVIGNGAPMTFTGGTIPAPGACHVTVMFTSAATITSDTVNLTLPANGSPGALSDDQLISNGSAVSDQATFALAHPTISKSFGTNALRPGQSTTLTINIANTFTSQALTAAAITDALPAGNPAGSITLDAAAPVIGANCGTPGVAGTGTANVAITAMTIPGAATCTITVTVDVSAAQVPQTLTNTIAPANFTSTQVNGANNTATAQLIITTGGGGFSIGKTTSLGTNGSVGPNTPFQYIVSFGSLAASVLHGGSFTDTLPTVTEPMFVVNDATHIPVATNCGAGPITLNAAPGATSFGASNLAVASGATCTVSVWVQFTTPPPAVNLIDTNTLHGTDVTFLDPGNNPVNGSNNAAVNITLLPSLTVQHYAFSAQSLVNQQVTEETDISDPTGVTDTNFVLTVPLTTGKVKLATTPNFTFGPTCPAGLTATPILGGEAFVTNAVTINANCTIRYDVIDELGASGSFAPANPTYTSMLSGGVAFAFAHQNTATFQTSNITISKAFAPNQIQAGGAAVASVTLSVDGIPGFASTQANGVTFPDTLPATVFFAANPNPTFAPGCQQAGQPAPSAVIAGNLITWSNISLLTNGTTPVPCSVGFTVSSVTLGTPTNVINAGDVHSTSGITNSQSVHASLTVSAGIAIVKTFPNPSFAIGSTTYMRLLLTNSTSPSTLTNGTLTDVAPAQLVLPNTTLGPQQAGDPALCAATIAGTVNTNNISVTGISVPGVVGGVAGQCVLYVPLAASLSAIPGATVTNTIPAAGLSFNAGAIQNQNPSGAGVSFTAAPPVTLSKLFTPNLIQPGGVSQLTITVTNNAANAAALNGMSLTDMLPPNVFVAPTPGASTTCTGGTVTAVAGTQTVSLNNGTLGTLAAPTGTCTITVNVTSSVSGIWTNVIAANALMTNQGATNTAAAQSPLNVGNTSGIGITKAFVPTVIAPGATSVLTITLFNNAATAVNLTNVALTDTMPANVTIAATPNTSTTCVGGTVTAAGGGTTVGLSGASLAVNASCTFSVTVTGTIPNTYLNTIPANAITSTQGSTNGNPAQANLTIGQPALNVVKTSVPSAATVSPGQTVAYTITVLNNGTQPETNAHVNDVLGNAALVPGSVTINNVAAPDAVITSAQSFGTIAIGSTTTIKYSATVNVAAPVGTLVTNTATLGGNEPCSVGVCTASSPPNTVAPPVITGDQAHRRQEFRARARRPDGDLRDHAHEYGRRTGDQHGHHRQHPDGDDVRAEFGHAQQRESAVHHRGPSAHDARRQSRCGQYEPRQLQSGRRCERRSFIEHRVGAGGGAHPRGALECGARANGAGNPDRYEDRECIDRHHRRSGELHDHRCADHGRRLRRDDDRRYVAGL